MTEQQSAAYTSEGADFTTSGSTPPHPLAQRAQAVRPMTKKEAGLRLAIIAAEIRLALDEDDADCPSWADDIDVIAATLWPGGH